MTQERFEETPEYAEFARSDFGMLFVLDLGVAGELLTCSENQPEPSRNQ